MEPKERVKIYQKVFGGMQGEKVLEDLSSACGFMQVGCHDNSHMNAYDKGRRDVFIYIKKLVESDAKQYAETQDEK